MTDTPQDAPRGARGEGAATPSLAALLDTYTAWSGRQVLLQAARRAENAGDAARADALRLMAGDEAAAPSALEALRAQHELASLLEGWRWQTVAAARDHGVTWSEIGQATRTDPTEALADYLAAVDQHARFGYLDGHRIADDPTIADDPADEDRAGEALSAEDPAVGDVEQWRGRPAAPDPLAADVGAARPGGAAARELGGLGDAELLVRAEAAVTGTRRGTPDERQAAIADLDAAAGEAELRAAAHGPDSVPAQVAGYISLLREDTDHALTAEATAWRADLDQLIPDAASTTQAPSELPAPRTVAERAQHVGARMQARSPSGHKDGADGSGGFDMDRLDRITDDHGYAVFDPAAPGGVRAPTEHERADLDRALASPPDPNDENEGLVEGAAVGGAGVGAHGFDRDPDTYAEVLTPAARAEREIGAVLARTADPDFPYDPHAEWGDPAYREPRSDEEAAARSAYLDTLPLGPRPRQLTEVESALTDAALQADLAVRAHDPDPRLDAQVRHLEALEELAPTAEQHDYGPSDEPPDAPAPEHDGHLDRPATGTDQARAGIDDRDPSQIISSARTAEMGDRTRSAAALDGVDLHGLQQRIDRMRVRLASEQHRSADTEDIERRDRLAHWSTDLTDHHSHADSYGDGPADRGSDGHADGDAS